MVEARWHEQDAGAMIVIGEQCYTVESNRSFVLRTPTRAGSIMDVRPRGDEREQRAMREPERSTGMEGRDLTNDHRGRVRPSRPGTGRAARPLGRLLLVALGAALLVACGSKNGGVAGSTGGATGGASGSATSTTGAPGTTGGGTADMGTGPQVTCEDQVFTDTDGGPTGLELCSNGAIYRKDAVTCHPRPLSDPDYWSCMYPGDTSPCVQDSDCKGFTSGGACIARGDDQGCACHYDCQTDADCGPGALCRCAPSPIGGNWRLNQCIRAEGCLVDADCPAGERCLLAPLREEYCLDTMVAHCTSPADECSGDADCPPAMTSGIARCEYDGQAGRFLCVEQVNCGP